MPQAKVKDVDFVRLGWGKKGSSDGSYGLIAGGMSDGSVLFWNARDLIEYVRLWFADVCPVNAGSRVEAAIEHLSLRNGTLGRWRGSRSTRRNRT